MAAIGYPTQTYKLIVFTVAGALAGLAGGLYVIYNRFVSPDALIGCFGRHSHHADPGWRRDTDRPPVGAAVFL